MTEPTVFQSATTDPVTPPVTPSTQPVLPPEVADLVGTGKKYATAEAALASIPHAQTHIATLEAEAIKLRDELAKRKTTEELLEELKQNGFQQGITTPTTGMTTDTVTQLVTKALEARETDQRAKQNVNVVTSVFTEKFGEKAEEVYIKIARESGLTVANLNKLAETSPSAVLKLAGIESKQTSSTVTKPNSSVNTESLTPNKDGTNLSARVGKDGSSKALVNAWKVAGQKIGKQEV